MNHDDKKKILGFYEKALAEFGNDPRSVHWADADTQAVRFEALAKMIPERNVSVLDVGCGLGDLYKFFASKSTPVDYVGIDIVPAFIERARERFPSALFLCGDAETLEGKYDYILASGVLSFAIPNAKAHYFNTIKTMYDHAKCGIAFNMLNELAHPSDDTFIAYDKDEVVRYCKTISPHVAVASNYLPWDFTIYMYKE
ncbi:MAG: class I SAM-dependent methyltransferase [Candidatus Pacebacteria bacterium]|jgi:trans-aconitate methyltransferase|nr:class I SAM-dependent methyltransferase [Candidatus Paceibacterota bacterium]